jgi:hypothetical protein
MSDTMVPGTLVSMQILRRFGPYPVGERIAVTMDQAQDLAAKRLATPLNILVPVTSPESAPADATPTRSPPQIVRK